MDNLMGNIRTVDMMLLDDLFEMHGGYVLNFSDRTFARFFAEELNLDIDDPAYSKNGSSKAKRLRCFLQIVDNATAIRALKALWGYREARRMSFHADEKVPNAQGRFLQLIQKLQGADREESQVKLKPAFDRAKFAELNASLMDLARLAPSPRGYEFEKYLKRLFDAFGLEARSAFRLVGEQIDGSFLLGSETYLLEAKWQNEPCGVADLHAFHGKVEEKAKWACGLFVSYSGFSEQGLQAFGTRKSIICLDGFDLSETLRRELPLDIVLERKARRAAETGVAFARVRDLF
jgi:Restriction endonuclease